ncbi:aminoacyl-tRNA hydrolase [Desulforhopalus singaporensis]|uniref:Peptidyl-tRNA hydrolase n=1 Tax=Desulforhopalus singaporensis TaxID=91360 RepID=A0A1H0MSV8_9BACT|nr:aminoacyl-tRNA hydrolase [Desulforhopalus singaporensis]SDO83467.1 peptidyl-tRNA hydrolase, PTH1 family [Desulforhopalus singaporensis]
MATEDLLLAGLGNPGEKYANTRHNIGFWVIEQLAEKWRLHNVKSKWDADYYSGAFCGRKVHLIKPQTFMNRSGDSVCRFFRFYKSNPGQLLVIHDDLDMDCGRIKLVVGGGSGGHNGIKSLVERLGCSDFYRLKIGIGRPGKGDVHPDFPVDRFVLGTVTPEESAIFEKRSPDIVRGIELFTKGDVSRATGLLNSLK